MNQPIYQQTGTTAKVQAAGDKAPFPEPVVLTPEQRSRMARRAGQGIVRALVAQALMGLLAIGLSAWISGAYAAASALIGAAAYFVPNALFALRLLLGLMGGGNAGALSFFWGEAFKLGFAVLTLATAAMANTGWLVWPALLFGLLCVLKGYVLLLFFRKLP
ncbi:ATP synthase subunit I [Alcaligenes faecalis]|nr:ATP synthase subunit I [Alcaligenes faecalis]